MDLVLVHGTWGRASEWHLPGGGLRIDAEAQGHRVFDFLWSGLLAGVGSIEARALYGPGDPLEKKSGADDGMLLPWCSEGEKLRLFCQYYELARPCVLSHSHGLQVVTYACVAGQEFQTAVSISGPMRRDMLRARRIAMACIGKWVQFADPQADRTIVEGEWFDGGGPQARFDLPEGITVTTPNSGHSGLIGDSALRATYALWEHFT